MSTAWFRSFVPVLLALLFGGALFWAKGRDPFERKWFAVRAAGFGKAACVAVLPKNIAHSTPDTRPAWPLPVVVYLHGFSDTLMRSGNELRQMTEMGLAAVVMEYNQTNAAACEAEFAALLDYLGRAKWADTNRMAWVGLSMGAQRELSFLLRHPERQTNLLVRLAGGWVPELEQFEVQSSRFKVQGSVVQPFPPVLLLHGAYDSVFPVSEVRRVADCLRTNGVAVELRVLPGQVHDFGPNRLQVFRAVGEYCLTRLNGADAVEKYQSILEWQGRAWPLWVYWLPAGAWTIVCWRFRRKAPSREDLTEANKRNEGEKVGTKPLCFLRFLLLKSPPRHQRLVTSSPAKWDVALRWVAVLMAMAALGVTALHLVPPHLPVSDRTLAIARKYLVQPKEQADFQFLAGKAVWRGKKLGTLLEHVELANYNRELINWKFNDQVYWDHVLSPEIEAGCDGELNWRRPLWESFYPRIRKEGSTEAAAGIVVRYLRERVTVVGKAETGKQKAEIWNPETRTTPSISEIWRRQITDPHGFECLYVAAMRSAGIPARLDAQGRAEFWTGSAWQFAPRPLVESCWGAGP